MTRIIIGGVSFQYKSDKGDGIIVHDEDGKDIGKWDSISDLRYDVENHPEWFKKEEKK